MASETWVLCRPASGGLEYLTGGADVWVSVLADVTLCWDTAGEAQGYARAMGLPAGSCAPLQVPAYVADQPAGRRGVAQP